MDKDKMVEVDISPEMIDSGERLIRQLDAIGLVPDAAFWIYLPDIDKWRLAIFEPSVGKAGPKIIYSRIRKVLEAHKDEIQLSLENIALIKPGAPLLALLRTAIRTGSGVAGIRFRKNVINGTLVEDAYIYRMK